MMDKLLIDIHQSLGISEVHLSTNKLKFQPQPDLNSLEIVEIDFEGKPFILQASAAIAWRAMKDAAQKNQIQLKPFSGFRSYLHQKSLIERHLKNERLIENILTHIAIPGFSEHHSGLAIDVHADGKNILEEDFEKTQEFLWLKKNAPRFEFRLSYPRDNDQGIIYEPWHWYYTGR
ncbi:MAG: M15 family metallopeptidase [Bdellovibrionaceae bacterium]|nr:M15 family metallopeptidase [Bdellovibrio sp.]